LSASKTALVVPLLLLLGCADQSKGAALNACRIKFWLDDPAVQGQLIPDCMAARSFEVVAGCGPSTNDYEWDWRVRTFAFNNPECYRPLSSSARAATLLSPM
jgi:hypothetical protein